MDYETRNLGNFSRLFPVEDKTKMDYYLNILSIAFNVFYPVGKNCVWRKTYDLLVIFFYYIDRVKFYKKSIKKPIRIHPSN